MILAIFFLFVVELLAFTFARLIPVELLSAGRTRQDIGATLAASGALEYTVAWMENELAEGREPTSSIRTEVRQTRTIGDWTCEVVAKPDAQTPPNGTSNQRVYLLTANASQQAGGHVYASLRTAVKQESFASYCRFVDQWTPGTWMACGSAQVRGRLHTNATLHIMVYPDFYEGPHPASWPNGPTFWGKVTAAGKDPSSKDGVKYRTDMGSEPPPYSFGSKKAIADHYKKIFKGGRSNLETGVAKIPMPPEPSLDSLAHSAYGSDSPPNLKNNKLHFNPGGGIYVDGPVSELTLQAPSGQTRQIFKLGGDEVTVVEVHSGSYVTPGGMVVPKGSTAILGPGAQERVEAALPNGVIYVNGKIEGLGGTNRAPHTLATKGDIEMARTADKAFIQQAGNPPPHGFTGDGPSLKGDPDHRFGIVCRHLVVPDFEHDNKNLYLYAAIVCSNGGDGQVRVLSRDTQANGTAKLVIVGSLVEDIRDYWASTHVPAGYGAVLQHDDSLTAQPPPNFPSTSRLLLQQVVFDIK